MTFKSKATPNAPQESAELETKRYRVLSKRCVWGKKGSVIERAFKPGIEATLFQSGVLELVEDAPETEDRPLKSAEEEG